MTKLQTINDPADNRCQSNLAQRPTVGIVIAMASEAAALFGRKAGPFAKGQLTRVAAPGNTAPHVVTLAGVGLENARAASEYLVSNGAKALVSIGLAGGLSPGLNTGHIAVATEVLQGDNGDFAEPLPASTACADQALASLKSAGLAVEKGPLLSTRQPILTCRHKAWLHGQTHGLTVDMESAAVARVAHLADVPFFGLRVVCDSAHETVPQELLNGLDPNGRIRLTAVLCSLARRPTLLSDMLRMGRLFATSQKALKRAWQILVAGGVPQALIGSR